MSRFLVTSLLFAVALIPALAARDANPVRGLRTTLLAGSAFFGFYLFELLFLYGRL